MRPLRALEAHVGTAVRLLIAFYHEIIHTALHAALGIRRTIPNHTHVTRGDGNSEIQAQRSHRTEEL